MYSAITGFIQKAINSVKPALWLSGTIMYICLTGRLSLYMMYVVFRPRGDSCDVNQHFSKCIGVRYRSRKPSKPCLPSNR